MNGFILDKSKQTRNLSATHKLYVNKAQIAPHVSLPMTIVYLETVIFTISTAADCKSVKILNKELKTKLVW